MIEDTTPFISNFCRLSDKIEIGNKIYEIISIDILRNTAVAKRRTNNGIAIKTLSISDFTGGKIINKSRG